MGGLHKFIKTCFTLTALVLTVSTVTACLEKPSAPPGPPANSAAAFKQKYEAQLKRIVLTTPSSVFKKQSELPITNPGASQGLKFFLSSKLGIPELIASAQTENVQITFSAATVLKNNVQTDQPVMIKFTDSKGASTTVNTQFQAPSAYQNIASFNNIFIGKFSRISSQSSPISLDLSQQFLNSNLVNAQNTELLNIILQQGINKSEEWTVQNKDLIKTALMINNSTPAIYLKPQNQLLTNVVLKSGNKSARIYVETTKQGYHPTRFLLKGFDTLGKLNFTENMVSSASLSTPTTKQNILAKINSELDIQIAPIKAKYSKFGTLTYNNNPTLTGGPLKLSDKQNQLQAKYTFNFKYNNSTPSYSYEKNLKIPYNVTPITVNVNQLSNQLQGSKLTLFKLNNNLLAWSENGIAVKENNNFKLVPFTNLTNPTIIDLKTNPDQKSAYAIVKTFIGSGPVYLIVQITDIKGMINFSFLTLSGFFGFKNGLSNLFIISQDYFFIVGDNGFVYEVNELDQEQAQITGFRNQVNITNVVGSSTQILFFTANHGLFSLNAEQKTVTQITLSGITAQTKFNNRSLIQTFINNEKLYVVFAGINNGTASIWRWEVEPGEPLKLTRYQGLPANANIKTITINHALSLILVNLDQTSGNRLYFTNLLTLTQPFQTVSGSNTDFNVVMIKTLINNDNYLLTLNNKQAIVLWKIQNLQSNFVFTKQDLSKLTDNNNITTVTMFIAAGPVQDNWQLVFTRNQKLIRYSSTWQQILTIQNLTGKAQTLQFFPDLGGFWLQVIKDNNIIFYNFNYS